MQENQRKEEQIDSMERK